MHEPLGKTSRAASVVFVIGAFVVAAVIYVGQFASWFLEQNAIADESLAVLGAAGKIWFIMQAFFLLAFCSLVFGFSKSIFRSVYQSWLLASVITLPMFALRFLGPNNDQVGAFLQIILAAVGALIMLSVRKRAFGFDRRALAIAGLIPFCIWPFLLWGAVGSGTDLVLNLVAGLALGLLAASLVVTTESNFFLNGLGIGVLLCILGSAFGYDGGQLLLLVVLPAFGFALVNFTSSVAAVTVGVGLLAAAPLIFVDPTELALVLGDLLPWAARAAFLMMALGLLLGLAIWAASRPGIRLRFNPLYGALLAWGLAVLVYGFFGLHGFYGDRLFVILKDQADVSQAATIQNRDARRAFVYQTLTAHATDTQAGLRQALNRFGIRNMPYYLVNALEVDGGALDRLYLLSRPEVDRVIPSPRLRAIPKLSPAMVGESTAPPAGPGWNIKMIGADRVWTDLGVTGKGIVVGQSDTGVDATHPALSDAYRGLAQGNDYNWYDPWSDSTTPNDREGHGTHTLGIVLGQNGVGVAPAAEWIACVNLERNLGDPAFYLDCMQFMLAPFPHNGNPFTDGDPTRSADVLNNSWGCPTLEGCEADSLRPAVDALRAAGIFVVVSAGNDGPACHTLSNPPAIYQSVLSVGAVDERGNIASFSSRGTVTFDGSNRVKPDISAPGVDVVSSLPRGSYGSESGTSMAGPHLVGVVALMWSANPDLVGNIDRTEQILEQTAKRYSGAEPAGECFTGGTPNNAYGYGVVDAYAAVKMALAK